MTRITVDIPVIETDRLILRAMQETDLDVIADFFADDRSSFVGGPKSRADSWRTIAGALGHWMLRGYGMWLAAERATDRPVGGVGFLFPEGWDEPELGWHLYNGHEGKGYAYEAAIAARTHGARHFGLDGVISYIAPDNTRSAALARRMGATLERQGTLLGHAVDVYRHPTQEAA
ncbi:GNAT family N-acetyltransferase [Lutimaribacter sp. EGI FJ00015]|uniref:GNAT family N-acetyltransferase n=1 Tax=Lutimaribacter degradans TaxID=2945989 RepID=A0ACC6A0G1_9RHOB|nr:GNAT family N-acetyltransferase [Lutimaribacter sp. EGI FJ00013]MCM2563099.1 GNAT family N-acetyltransferase [Lutimaribacter sp. EGI FJ00013]MCO0614278.1 GNAT family N-acetyltransferase [Lutimaribacter sp. EGI FJ00015]MCO0637088.1 GNAT family N-acetyltransferase [Lutimaribacter sp. EGI FJ00014]